MVRPALQRLAQCEEASDLEGQPAPQPLRSWRLAAALLAGCIALAVLVCLAPARSEEPAASLLRRLDDDQHFWIVRHGDKYSSYPRCPEAGGGTDLCYDEARMGDNPPLTPCGRRQAEHTARWLQPEAAAVGGIGSIAVSPYTRTLQTALPLAQALNLSLKVEYLLSEANQPEGPHREFNVLASNATVRQLREVGRLWDLGYGSPPIPTPETPALYGERVRKAAAVLRARFPPAKGNVAVYTHATTSFSVAYGLCHGEDGDDGTLQAFVEKQAAIAPAGVIHVILSGAGRCKRIDQTANVAEEVGCGETEPFKCDFEDFPAWYWPHSNGRGPGKCH